MRTLNMNKFFILLFALILGSNCFAMLCEDTLVESTLKDKEFEKPVAHLTYDYSDTKKIPVKLAISKKISSEKEVYEGKPIQFKVLQDVCYRGKLVISKGTVVPARVETIVKSGMNGIPASIIVGNFEFEGIPKGKISNSYEVKGQDRSLWVFPLKWALTFLPPTGSLTNFIKGGHAKIKENHTIIIYYYPNWV